MALVATAAQLEQLCRGYRVVQDRERAPKPEERSVRKRLLAGGMVKVEMVLEPDEADLVLRAIERAREVSARVRAPLRPSGASCPSHPSQGLSLSTFPRKRPGHQGRTAP